MAGIRIIDKIMPKNDGFTGLCDADQIIGGSNIPLNTGDKVILDNDESGDSYYKHNTTTDYIEFWVDGVKRLEL